MTTLNARNDIGLDNHGNMSLANRLEAIRQACEQKVKFFRGESFLYLLEGVPYSQEIIPNINYHRFIATLISGELLKVNGVEKIRNVDIDSYSKNRLLLFHFEIETNEGSLEIEAAL